MRRWQQPAIVCVAALIVVTCSVAPLVALALEGTSGGAFELLARGATWRLFGATFVTSIAVTALALAIGVPLGVLLGRADVVGRRVLLLVHVFPTFVPPFLLALGWFHLFGQRGLLGDELTSNVLFGRAGLVVVLGLAFAPIVTVMTVLGLDGIDPALDDAARTIAAPRRVIARILLPLAQPSIALAALVVFALAFAELGVPMFLRVDAYPAAVFARLGGIDYAPGEAFVLVLPQFVVAAALLFAERRWVGTRVYDVLGMRRDRAPYALGRSRIALTAVCSVVVAIGLAPLLALGSRADWGEVSRWVGDSVGNGLIDAMVAATIMTACGIVLGHALARGVRSARILEGSLVFAFVMPAAALGAGLIAVWNRPSTQVVYATSAIIVVGYVARYAILGVRPLALAIARSNRLDDAAAVAGAGYLRRMVRIVVPNHGRLVLATWLLCVVFCLRDLETAVIYYPAGRETLPVRIFTLEANGPPGAVAALAMLHVAITAGVLSLGLVVLRRRR